MTIQGRARGMKSMTGSGLRVFSFPGSGLEMLLSGSPGFPAWEL